MKLLIVSNDQMSTGGRSFFRLRSFVELTEHTTAEGKDAGLAHGCGISEGRASPERNPIRYPKPSRALG
jgi:hypothetical protein